jgi:hypothetical protein
MPFFSLCSARRAWRSPNGLHAPCKEPAAASTCQSSRPPFRWTRTESSPSRSAARLSARSVGNPGSTASSRPRILPTARSSRRTWKLGFRSKDLWLHHPHLVCVPQLQATGSTSHRLLWHLARQGHCGGQGRSSSGKVAQLVSASTSREQPNPSIERTCHGRLRLPRHAAHVER